MLMLLGTAFSGGLLDNTKFLTQHMINIIPFCIKPLNFLKKMELFSYCNLTAPMELVRGFFNNSANLLKITPLSFLFKVEPEEELKEGMVIRLKFLGFTIMESLIRDVGAFGFTDIALKKPFFIRHWEHRHKFIPKGNSTVIEDHLTVESLLPNVLLRLFLRLMFIYRCRRLKDY